jgi:tetratricopeptide (TPR) repeat protein
VDNKTRQDLKPTYLTANSSGLAFTSAQSRRSVLVSAGVLLAVILVLAIGAAIYTHRVDAAQAAFGDAMQAYQTPVATPGQQVPPGVKTYGSVAERAKAASSMFASIADTYGMTPAGRNALYFEGLTQMEAGQNSAAEATLKKASDSWDKDVAALSKFALAQMYGQMGRTQDAVNLYQKLTASPASTVPAGVAQLQLAALYEAKGDTAAARKIYDQLKDKDAKSAAGMIAAQKLNPTAEQQPMGPQ